LPFLYEVETGSANYIGGFLAKSIFKTAIRDYEARATIIQREDDKLKTTIFVTAPGKSQVEIGDQPWPPYRYQYTANLPSSDVREIFAILNQLCEKSHNEEFDRRNAAPNEIRTEGSPVDRFQLARRTFSPWALIGNDIARQYDFENLGGQGTKTMFQVRCTVEMGSFGHLFYHVHFIMHPAVVTENCFHVAFLATVDEKVESGFFAVRTVCLNGGGNMFWVENPETAQKCLAVLHAGMPMRFMLLNKQECIAKIPLENDTSYCAKFEEIQERVSKQAR